MLKPSAISQAPAPRTAQPLPRAPSDSCGRSGPLAPPARARAQAHAQDGANFACLLRRPTGDADASPDVSGLPADDGTRGSIEADRDAAQHDREPASEDGRGDFVVDRTPIAVGEGPGAPYAFASAAVGARDTSTTTLTHVDELFAQLVTRAAVDRGGDAKRGSMRLELGGRLVGRGHVTVHAEGGDVEIEIAAPRGVDADVLEARVTRRLATKGVRVTRFDVR